MVGDLTVTKNELGAVGTRLTGSGAMGTTAVQGELTIQGIYPEVPGQKPLRWMTELGRLSEIPAVKLKLTIGPEIREPQVAQALRADSELVILSGHGKENGFLLPSGRVIKGRWIATQAKGRRCPPRAIILASCASGAADENNESLTWQIAKAGINVVGMPPDMPDEAAIGYLVEFVRAIIAQADIGEAHDVGVEAIEDQWPAFAREVRLFPGLTNGYRFIIERLNGQEQRLASVEQKQERTLELLEQLVGRR